MNWVCFWLGITALSALVEFITNDMVSIWFAGGGLVAMVLALLGLGWFIHVPVFIVVSLVLLLCFRKIVLKYFYKGESRTNADSAIGREYELLEDIGFNKNGSIKVNDVVWTAVAKDQKTVIPAGTIVKVKEIKGNKYVVEEVNNG